MVLATISKQSIEDAPHRYEFSIDEYLQLYEKGILPPELRTELIDGEVIRMTPPGPEHSSFVLIVSEFLRRRLPADWYAATEIVIKLGKHLPVPDVTIFRGSPLDHLDNYLTPSDIGLLVEVAKSSLNYDLEYKAKLYAENNIAQYLVVDLENREMTFFHAPEKNGYQKTTRLRINDQVPLLLGEIVLSFSLAEIIKR